MTDLDKYDFVWEDLPSDVQLASRSDGINDYNISGAWEMQDIPDFDLPDDAVIFDGRWVDTPKVVNGYSSARVGGRREVFGNGTLVP